MAYSKKTKYIAITLIAIILAAGIFIGFESAPEQKLRSNTPALSQIEGLKTGDKISYKIFGHSKNTPVTGEATPSANGTVTLPSAPHKNGQNLAYDLEIKRGTGAQNILLQYNEAEKRYKISGNNLGQFNKISYGINDQTFKSKTDWAGIFEDTNLQSGSTKENDQITIAFNAINVHDGINLNPSIVKIKITAPGGGVGKSPNGVNQYTESGNPWLSAISRKPQLRESTNRIVSNLVIPLMSMTEQFSAVMYQHIMMVGTMMDADIQMDTQRDYQKLQAEAHRDYHPSEQMCVMGTFVRSLHNAETRADFNKISYSEIMMNRYTAQKNTSGAKGPGPDILERIKKYQDKYCDMADHNSGLSTLCDEAIPDKKRTNKDINYPLTILKPLTLDVDFSINEETQEEEDVIALGKNLYWSHPFSPISKESAEAKGGEVMNSRRILAMHNVAHTTLSSIVGQKSEAFESGTEKNSGTFMKNLIEMLIPEQEDGENGEKIGTSPTDILGENPSYYAMMEVLTKKMYQDGNFYTNLYDKPTNVARIKTSMDAIQLMHNRDRYESLLRREMLSSLLLETALMEEETEIDSQIKRLSTTTQGGGSGTSSP